MADTLSSNILNHLIPYVAHLRAHFWKGSKLQGQTCAGGSSAVIPPVPILAHMNRLHKHLGGVNCLMYLVCPDFAQQCTAHNELQQVSMWYTCSTQFVLWRLLLTCVKLLVSLTLCSLLVHKDLTHWEILAKIFLVLV